MSVAALLLWRTRRRSTSSRPRSSGRRVWRSPVNYHLPSDIPANLDYDSVVDATRLVYDLARSLVSEPPGELV